MGRVAVGGRLGFSLVCSALTCFSGMLLGIF